MCFLIINVPDIEESLSGSLFGFFFMIDAIDGEEGKDVLKGDTVDEDDDLTVETVEKIVSRRLF